MRISFADAARATGGTAEGPGGEGIVFEGVATDTRTDLRGRLFVALRGERFDGHDFLAEAATKGAAGVLFSRGNPPADVPALRVDDTLAALGRLGRWARRRPGFRVAAVTGSFGKTTTKDLAVALLRAGGGTVLGTEGNLNNRIGLPMTLLRGRGDEEYGVLELGVSVPGEMAHLAAVCEPDVALVTGVGAAHTEGLGSLAGVAEEKLDVAGGLPPGGTLLLPHGDPLLIPPPELAERGVRVVSFGWEAGASVRGESLESLGAGGSRFRVEGRTVRVGLAGRHNAANALAAWALARALGAPMPEGEDVFAAVATPRLRGEIRPGPKGTTLLVDCYNANPRAVAAALDTLAELAGASRKIFVLGEMRELGTLEESAHREIGRLAVERGVSILHLVGPAARWAGEGAAEAGLDPARIHRHPDRQGVAESLAATLAEGDWVLIKGSRAAGLDHVAEALEARKVREEGDAL
jgi:UDP-N-acetylmuramoyl-tripeptide--D-alanyl-D-alanine ligase